MTRLTLRQKRSGNFEIINSKNKTKGDISFTTIKSIKEFWINERITNSPKYGQAIIKANYRLSQTYFSNVDELLKFIKS